jgi:hypothetical protein
MPVDKNPVFPLLRPINISFIKGIKGLLKVLAMFPKTLYKNTSTSAESKARK